MDLGIHGFTTLGGPGLQTLPGFGADRDAARDNLRAWLDKTGRAHWTIKD